MKYIIMCGGSYPAWGESLKQMVDIHGEPNVVRTIRMLREHGVSDIAISSNDDRFEQIGVPVLRHQNDYLARCYNDSDGFWCDAFYPTDEPTCYLFGDVIYSPDAIRTIVEAETDDIIFFGSKPPFAPNYPKPYIEPFGFKVVDTDHLKAAQQKVKDIWNDGRFNRIPIAWELWNVIHGEPDPNCIDYDSYIGINDYTCDIDTPDEVEKVRRVISD